jgi:hypothetical protein
MSCSGNKSTKKGYYNKVNNLKQPIGYTIDSKGNIKPIYDKNKFGKSK